MEDKAKVYNKFIKGLEELEYSDEEIDYILREYVKGAVINRKGSIEWSAYDDIPYQQHKDRCVCGVAIIWNIWLVDPNDRSKVIVIGSQCITHFDKRDSKYCLVCSRKHTNNSYNLCDDHMYKKDQYKRMKYQNCGGCNTFTNQYERLEYGFYCILCLKNKNIINHCKNCYIPSRHLSKRGLCRSCNKERCKICTNLLRNCKCKICRVCDIKYYVRCNSCEEDDKEEYFLLSLEKAAMKRKNEKSDLLKSKLERKIMICSLKKENEELLKEIEVLKQDNLEIINELSEIEADSLKYKEEIKKEKKKKNAEERCKTCDEILTRKWDLDNEHHFKCLYIRCGNQDCDKWMKKCFKFCFKCSKSNKGFYE